MLKKTEVEMEGYKLGSVSKNERSRKRKAQKIITILSDHISLQGKTVLDIGTGAGYIAQALAEQANHVESVDIVDDRIIKDNYKHTLVTDEALPFPDNMFDVVVTNQVLEHVPDQDKHLAETRRVLKDNGVVYLATPNKWWLADPHYKLPLISWLPRRLAGVYLKVTKGRKWDIYSISLSRLTKLAESNGYSVTDKTWPVMTNPEKYAVSLPKAAVGIMKVVPDFMAMLLLHVVPTHIKILNPVKTK